MPRRRELALTAAVLLVAAAVAWTVGVRRYLAPLLATRAQLRQRIVAVSAQKRWIREREADVAAMKTRLEELGNMAAALDPCLIGPEQGIRLPQARDRAVTGMQDHLLSPVSTGGVPDAFTFPAPVDPGKHLDELRSAFLAQHPRAVFEAWRVPGEIEVLQYRERFALECSYAELFGFLARLETDPLLVEVTDLRATGFRTDRAERVSVSIELSGFGWGEAGAR